jgi:hypothetical protein
VQLETGDSMWLPPHVTPLWGDYFAPSAEEAKLTVETAGAALEKGLVSAETATRYVASTFGVEDVEDELEDVTEEADEAAVDELAKADAMGAIGTKHEVAKKTQVDAAAAPPTKD